MWGLVIPKFFENIFISYENTCSKNKYFLTNNEVNSIIQFFTPYGHLSLNVCRLKSILSEHFQRLPHFNYQPIRAWQLSHNVTLLSSLWLVKKNTSWPLIGQDAVWSNYRACYCLNSISTNWFSPLALVTESAACLPGPGRSLLDSFRQFQTINSRPGGNCIQPWSLNIHRLASFQWHLDLWLKNAHIMVM